MNIDSSPSYAGIQAATKKLNRIANDIAQHTKTSSPNNTDLSAPLTPSSEASPSKNTRSSDDVETYSAQGRINDQRRPSIDALMVELINAENNLQANVEIAKATNNLVGIIIDETV